MTSRLRRPRKSIFSRPERLDVVVGDLRHDVALVVQAHRDVVGDVAGRDDHAGRVHALVAHQALEGARGVEDLLGDRVVVVGLGQLGARLHRVGQLDADRALGHELGDAVDLAVAVAEHAAGVAHHRAGEQLAEGADAGHRRRAVLLRDVLHHAVAAGDREVGVDVGHALAPGVEEALEEQVVRERVEVDDPQRVGHQRAGGRSAPGAHADAVLARPAHVVPHDQEVAGEAHLGDDAELEAQPLLRALGRAVRVAAGHALAAQALEVDLGGLVAGHREARQLDVAQRQRRGPCSARRSPS